MEVNLNVEKKDIKVVKEFLEGKITPVHVDEIVNKLALFKTRHARAHKVKYYDPECEYKIGDLIYKEYPGKIPVGAKKNIELNHGVVLSVVGVRTRFGIEEIILNYEGTSDFKKYIAYLERQKIELLLPHKQTKPAAKPEFIDQDNDPRQKQDPLEKKDFNALKKKLAAALNKEHDIAFISEKALLNSNLKQIDDSAFTKIREFLTENKKSETTEFFVENFVKIKPEDPDFDSYCFSLNFRMQQDYKIDFQQTRHEGWGKWNLISVIYYMKKNSSISEPNPLARKVTFNNKKNILQRRRKFEEELFADGSARYYLTQREITAGAVKLKPGLFDLGESIETEIIDSKNKKPYLVYHYSDSNILLGFKEIFEKYKALQGMILSFEQTPDEKFQFTIRTTKKGTIAEKVEYNPDTKTFDVQEEKVASPVFVNKAMFLESDIFKKVSESIDELRQITTLNKLVHKIFLEFGIKEKNYEIHILRLYHILDLIYPVDLKLVEDVILSNSEFIPSEKVAGVFYLDSHVLSEIEEEELKRKEIAEDEFKKRKEEIKRKKQEQELLLKEEIKRKREERRKKREEEMWQKEKLKREKAENASQAHAGKKELDATKDAKKKIVKPRRDKPEKLITPLDAVSTSKETLSTEERLHKEAAAKKAKKRLEEEKAPKTGKRVDKKPTDDGMSEDDIKSQIELERLKDKLRDGKSGRKRIKKKKEIAYKDDGGFGGIFASKLDQVVKKEDSQGDE